MKRIKCPACNKELTKLGFGSHWRMHERQDMADNKPKYSERDLREKIQVACLTQRKEWVRKEEKMFLEGADLAHANMRKHILPAVRKELLKELRERAGKMLDYSREENRKLLSLLDSKEKGEGVEG